MEAVPTLALEQRAFALSTGSSSATTGSDGFTQSDSDRDRLSCVVGTN